MLEQVLQKPSFVGNLFEPIDLRYIKKATNICSLIPPENMRSEDCSSEVVYISFNNLEDACAFIEAHKKQFGNLLCGLSNAKNKVWILDTEHKIKCEQILERLETIFGKETIKKLNIGYLADYPGLERQARSCE